MGAEFRRTGCRPAIPLPHLCMMKRSRSISPRMPCSGPNSATSFTPGACASRSIVVRPFRSDPRVICDQSDALAREWRKILRLQHVDSGECVRAALRQAVDDRTAAQRRRCFARSVEVDAAAAPRFSSAATVVATFDAQRTKSSGACKDARCWPAGSCTSCSPDRATRKCP